MNIALLTMTLLLAIGSLVIKKSVPAMISFILMMSILGLFYINLDAKLLGLFQIFIYTGGIMVLMLFGVTIIGLEFPKVKTKPLNAFLAFLFFIIISILFLRGVDTLTMVKNSPVEDVSLFSQNYSDFIIIFALIGISILYGTVKMSSVLKPKKRLNDV
ncbi:MAG: NADH-quinone oxidoreductase subunit J [Sulfurovum sp.]